MNIGDSLETTPTWDIAAVCFVFVAASILVERGLHFLSKVLKKKKQGPLGEALEKVKEELMFMGFISLLLSIFQPIVASLCVDQSLYKHMLPCKHPGTSSSSQVAVAIHNEIHVRRFLGGGGDGPSKCLSKGKVPFISSDGLHQLHIFLFIMALIHLFYSCCVIVLGRMKVSSWKIWEDEVVDVYENSPPHDYSFLHSVFHATFDRDHHREFVQGYEDTWNTITIMNCIASLARHLSFKTVNQAVYLSLRTGFLKSHHLKRNFDFHGFIMLSFEDDSKVVVGISSYLWAFVILFLLINVNGWHSYIWTAFIPLFLLLIVGTKLQTILTERALEIASSELDQKIAVKPRDELFWFKRPNFTLRLIHFISFQNAYEIAFFFWIWFTLGHKSCYLENDAFIALRLIIGVFVQFLCGYNTLPLYALVTQMGSKYNKSIFHKHVKGKDKKDIYIDGYHGHHHGEYHRDESQSKDKDHHEGAHAQEIRPSDEMRPN